MERTPRFLLAGTIAGAALFGGAALAGAQDSASDADQGEETETTLVEESDALRTTTDETVTEESDTDESDTDDSDADARQIEEGDDASVDSADEVGVLTGHDGDHPTNHGLFVAEAAHSTEPGPGHGEAVREVAQSNAGKEHPEAQQSEDAQRTEGAEKTEESEEAAETDDADDSDEADDVDDTDDDDDTDD